MRELLRSTDIVLLTYAASLLQDAAIFPIIADVHISAVEGSIGAFPRRMLVLAEDWRESVEILTEAGLGNHLTEDASGAW